MADQVRAFSEETTPYNRYLTILNCLIHIHRHNIPYFTEFRMEIVEL